MNSTLFLLMIAAAYSATLVAAGRRLPRPAPVAAYATALAMLVAVPLLPDATAQRVDRVVSIVGAGRLLVHLAFMTVLSGLLLTIVLATRRWSWRQQLALGGAGVLTGLFVLCWLWVQTLPLSARATLFYSLRAGHPAPVLWMNVVMGLGIVYIAAWSWAEYYRFLLSARTSYERGIAGVVLGLYTLAAVAGTLTIVEAVGRHDGVDMAWVHHVKLPLTVGVLTAAAGMLVAQVWLWPLWRQRRQLLARYVEPELVQLRDDLLNLSAVQAALQLDIHQEAYANRIIVEAVAARCRAAGVSAARQATARMAASLLTFQRTNMLKDPIYDPDTSWEALTEEAAAEIDKMMALTAWQKAMRESYVSQDVYILLFLVLDSPAYREQLLIDERPRVAAWHQTLADLIATVMHEHGQSTPRSVTLARRSAPGSRLARIRTRLASRGGRAAPDRGMAAQDEAGHAGGREPTT